MHKKAFTLVELMIAVAIVGILTGLATVSYTSVRQRARDAQRQNDLNQLKINLTTYFGAQVPSSYPAAATTTTLNNTNDPLAVALKTAYAQSIPLDPTNSGVYVYKYQTFNSNRDYTLFGTLENTNNNKGWGGGSSWVADGYQVKPD
jgi:prepilin-type N-terminal cleavage/methylation domain-containing protein